MQINKKIFNVTNALLIVLIILALIFIYITYGTYKNFQYEQEKMEAFYITNAGINQAIWYLSTPISLGGYGPKWRAKNLKKYFSTGFYTITVEDGSAPGEIIISSVGNAKEKTLKLQVIVVYGKSIPSVFDYALFSGNELEISGASSISGNLYANDNLRIKNTVTISKGNILTHPGYNIDWEGNANFKNIAPKKPYPVLPVLDTTFYYNKISIAKSGEKNVLQGDYEFKNLDLKGKTIYVNGNVRIKGDMKSAGTIVCTRNMSFLGKGNISNGSYYICNGKMIISGKHNVSGNAYFYSKQKLSLENRSIVQGGAVFLSPTFVDIGENSKIAGLIYAPSIAFGKGVKIEGSIAAENFASHTNESILEDVVLNYDQSTLPLSVLGFNIGSKVIMRKPGSLKEI